MNETMKKKELLRFKSEGIPAHFKELGDFLIWDQGAKNGERRGKPVSIGGVGNSVSRPQDWRSFKDAEPILAKSARYYPLLVLTEEFGVTCFDVDKKPRKDGEAVEECDARHERAEKAFRKLVKLFPHAYIERSKSRQGYHVFVNGTFDGPNVGSGGAGGEWSEVEVYCRKRGIALTGRPVKGVSCRLDRFGCHDSSDEIQTLVDQMRPPKAATCEENFANGSIPEDHARSILKKLSEKLGYPERDTWVKIASAVADGVGEDLAVELMDKYFPDEESHAHEKLLSSLGSFAPWETLRAFGVDPTPPGGYFSKLLPLSSKEGGMGGGYDFEAIRERTAFDSSNPPPKPVPVVSLRGKGICTRGNLSILQGPTKAGKSAVFSAIGGAAIASLSQSEANDLLGLSVNLRAGDSVLHLDTEQSRYHHHALCKRMLKRAGVDKLEFDFWSHSITELEIEERKRFLVDSLDALREEDGVPPSLVLLDGVADFCRDVNNIEEANDLVRWLHQIAIGYDCVVLCVIHENPGTQNGKTRGHLGSELARKAETSLKVTKDNKTEQSTLWAHETRGEPVPERDGVCFRWDDREGMHVTLGNSKEVKEQAERDKFALIVEKVFRVREESLCHKELTERIESVENVRISTAKARVKRWSELGLIRKEGGVYLMEQGIDDDL